LPIRVPVAGVTPPDSDQYRLYESAPLTPAQETVIWVLPALALTPAGAAGTCAAGASTENDPDE
jgi:hypothetical protein